MRMSMVVTDEDDGGCEDWVCWEDGDVVGGGGGEDDGDSGSKEVDGDGGCVRTGCGADTSTKNTLYHRDIK